VVFLFFNDPGGALQVALRGNAIAETIDNPVEAALSEAQLGISWHIVGDQTNAQRHCEAALARMRVFERGSVGHFESNRLFEVRCALASTLWLRGFPDKAAIFAGQVIDELATTEDFLLLSNSLNWLIPIFLWSGDWPTSRRLIDRLIENARVHAMDMIEHVGIGLKGQLLVGRGEVLAGLALLQKSRDALQSKAFQTANIMSAALGLAAIGDFKQALSTIDLVIPEDNRSWTTQYSSEIFRIKAHILASTPGEDIESADRWLMEADETARARGALSWELRIATSRAALWRKQGRADEARDMLASVYGRFTEGFHTIDLIAAKRLLDELA
jgi:hypothetical protein